MGVLSLCLFKKSWTFTERALLLIISQLLILIIPSVLQNIYHKHHCEGCLSCLLVIKAVSHLMCEVCCKLVMFFHDMVVWILSPNSTPPKTSLPMGKGVWVRHSVCVYCSWKGVKPQGLEHNFETEGVYRIAAPCNVHRTTALLSNFVATFPERDRKTSVYFAVRSWKP